MCIWRQPSEPFELSNDEVDLWQADLDECWDSLPALQCILAPEERRKASQFRLLLHRNRYIVGRAALRSVLAAYVRIPPDELAFDYGPQGKPRLAGGAVRFNASHSHGLAVYAISNSRELGVDVERVRPGVEDEVAGWCLSVQAIRLLEGLPARTRRRSFFRAWARMEASSKLRGDGLLPSLQHFEVFLARNDTFFFRVPNDPRGTQPWWIHDFSPHQGYVGALAAQGGQCRLRCWKWQGPKVTDRSVGHGLTPLSVKRDGAPVAA